MIQAALATAIGLSHELDALFAPPSRPARPAPIEVRRTAPAAADPDEDCALCKLVARVGASDTQALEALYDATVGRVYGTARGITRDLRCAEEVTEDVYWQVWRQALRFDRQRGPVMAWLLTLARTRALDLPRRRDQATSHPEPHAQVDSAGDHRGNPARRISEAGQGAGVKN